MDQSETGVYQWLRSEGRKVRQGDEPPDFVVDGDIAVEVTTLSDFGYLSVAQSFEKFFSSLGPAENGRGYEVSIEYEDEKVFKGRKKAELRKWIKQKLDDHYRNPDSRIQPDGYREIFPPYDVTLRIRLWRRRDDPPEYKYTLDYLLPPQPPLVEKIQAAIDKKSANTRIQERTAKYREWWLVVTGFHHPWLDQQEKDLLSDGLVLQPPWKYLIAVNSPTQGCVLKSRENGNSDGS